MMEDDEVGVVITLSILDKVRNLLPIIINYISVKMFE
jgi:hypothetical protein